MLLIGDEAGVGMAALAEALQRRWLGRPFDARGIGSKSLTDGEGGGILAAQGDDGHVAALEDLCRAADHGDFHAGCLSCL